MFWSHPSFSGLLCTVMWPAIPIYKSQVLIISSSVNILFYSCFIQSSSPPPDLFFIHLYFWCFIIFVLLNSVNCNVISVGRCDIPASQLPLFLLHLEFPDGHRPPKLLRRCQQERRLRLTSVLCFMKHSVDLYFWNSRVCCGWDNYYWLEYANFVDSVSITLCLFWLI